MEAKTKLTTLISLCVLMLLNTSNIYSQCLSPVQLAFPNRYEMQVPANFFFTATKGTANCGLPSAGTHDLLGMGVNQDNPQYMLDILCNPNTPTKNDVNVSTTAALQNVGYRIGGNMVLWHNGSVGDIFVGVGAGNNAGVTDNVCVGYNAGNLNTGNSQYSVLVGFEAGLVNQAGGETFVGYEAGLANTQPADFNTFIGYQAGQSNVAAGDNVFVGANSGQGTNGAAAQYNCFAGTSSGIGNLSGSGNTFIGQASGATCSTGNNNLALGYSADVFNNGNNEIAIGYSAVANATNTMILGDNSVNVGIGMSSPGVTAAPSNKLEISYYSAASPDPTGTAIASTFTSVVGAGPPAKGTSGLQFRDLTTTSPQYNYITNQGFLTVDDNGNVVYMQPPPAVVSGTGSFGLCTPGPIPGLSGNEGLNLNGFNLFFAGNSSTHASQNNVIIGNGCGYAPKAKLDVLQASLDNNTIGIYVANTDLSNGTLGNPKPLIGIASFTPQVVALKYYNIAGWFEARGRPLLITSAPFEEYGIFVPETWNGTGYTPGGTVDIGYPFATDQPDFLLDVNGLGRTSGGIIPSDSILKKNVVSFTYGIKAIRNLNPVSYKYNGMGGFDSTKSYIGIIAQNLHRNVPNGVVTSLIVKDTTTYDTTTIMNVYEEAVMYTAINAIKEVDSAVTKNAHTDSTVAKGLWSTTGNAGLGAGANNYIGTSDTATLKIKVDNNLSGWLDAGSYQNTLYGYKAGLATHAKDNTVFGFEALTANVAQSGNVAMGDSALYTQSYSTAFNSGNVAIGNSALFANQPSSSSNGEQNTAIGNWAMKNNTTGSENTAVGYQAAEASTTTTNNTAVGYQALIKSTTNGGNTAVGASALDALNTAIDGTAIGYVALNANTSGTENTAVGAGAMYANTTGGDNASLGYHSLFTNTTGSENTALGYIADNGQAALSNTTCLGYNGGSYISTNNVSNAVQLGNSSVTKIYAAVNAITISDSRVKTNVQQNVPGLNFIKLLTPVTFNYSLAQENALGNIIDSTPNYPGKYDIENTRFSGFLAQDVQTAANSIGYDFSGVVPGQIYGLRYSEFVVPLVKAVQDLSASKDSMRSKLDSVQSTLDSLRTAFQNIQSCLNSLCGHTQHHKIGNHGSGGDSNSATTNMQDVTLSGLADAPLLYQNIPNPFSTGTKINYYLPQGTMGASMVFYDSYGNQIKQVQLSQTGNGTLNITPDNLTNGIYSYSLVVNGNVMDTKRMVLQK